MPWSDTATCWTLESYDSGVAHLLFPAGDRAARATWSIKDKVEVMRGLSEFGAQQVADAVNDGSGSGSGSGDDNTQTTNHATVERVGDSGQYAVRKTTHEVTFEGTEYSDESGASSAGSGGGGLTGG